MPLTQRYMDQWIYNASDTEVHGQVVINVCQWYSSTWTSGHMQVIQRYLDQWIFIFQWHRGTWTSGNIHASDTEVLGPVYICQLHRSTWTRGHAYASELRGPVGMHMPMTQSYMDQWARICQWHRATWTNGHTYASDTEVYGPVGMHMPVTQRHMGQRRCQRHRATCISRAPSWKKGQPRHEGNPLVHQHHIDQILSSFQCPIHSATNQYPWRPSTAAQMTGDTMQGNKGKPLALSPNLTQGFLPNEQQNAKQKHKEKEKEAS